MNKFVDASRAYLAAGTVCQSFLRKVSLSSISVSLLVVIFCSFSLTPIKVFEKFGDCNFWHQRNSQTKVSHSQVKTPDKFFFASFLSVENFRLFNCSLAR